MDSFSGVFLAILLLAFMIVSTIKVAKEVTSAMVDVKVDDGFQQKLLGIGLMIAGWFTGGAAKALGKVAWMQKMNENTRKVMSAGQSKGQGKFILPFPKNLTNGRGGSNADFPTQNIFLFVSGSVGIGRGSFAGVFIYGYGGGGRMQVYGGISERVSRLLFLHYD